MSADHLRRFLAGVVLFGLGFVPMILNASPSMARTLLVQYVALLILVWWKTGPRG